MRTIIAAVGLSFALSFSLSAADKVPPTTPQAKVGGYAKAEVTKQEVLEAAKFAVQAQAKALQQDGKKVELKLVKILAAEEQVVAGMNFRLKLQVLQDGKAKQAEAVVWWQAWRKPDPYQLTAWKWQD